MVWATFTYTKCIYKAQQLSKSIHFVNKKVVIPLHLGTLK